MHMVTDDATDFACPQKLVVYITCSDKGETVSPVVNEDALIVLG
jgi:hypothetical protein